VYPTPSIPLTFTNCSFYNIAFNATTAGNTNVYFTGYNFANGTLYYISNGAANINAIVPAGDTFIITSALYLVGNTPKFINNGTMVMNSESTMSAQFIRLDPGSQLINLGVWIMGPTNEQHPVIGTPLGTTTGTIYNMGKFLCPDNNDQITWFVGYTGDFYQCSNAVWEIHYGPLGYEFSSFYSGHVSGTLLIYLDAGGKPNQGFKQLYEFTNTTTGKLNMVLTSPSLAPQTLCYGYDNFVVDMAPACDTGQLATSINPADDCPASLFATYKPSFVYSGSGSSTGGGGGSTGGGGGSTGGNSGSNGGRSTTDTSGACITSCVSVFMIVFGVVLSCL